MGSGASSFLGTSGRSTREQPSASQEPSLSPNEAQFRINGNNTQMGSSPALSESKGRGRQRDEGDSGPDELTDRILSSGHVQETPAGPEPLYSARSGVSDGAAVAEMFAHTAMSLGMDNEDLLFNLMYFGGDNQNGTLGSVMEGVQQETLALHSEGNTPYKLKPASASAISGLHHKVFGVDIVSSDCECQVCKEDIEPDSEVLQLPVCQHFFHEECLLRWIKLQGWCPVCRASISATVVESVRQEVEPIAEESPSVNNDFTNGVTCGMRSEGPSARLFDGDDTMQASRADDSACDSFVGGGVAVSPGSGNISAQRSPRGGVGATVADVFKPPGQSSMKCIS